MKNLLLWLNAFLLSIICGAALFFLVSIQPNWKSGNVEDIIIMNAFFHVSDASIFFKGSLAPSVLVSLICTIVFWKGDKVLRKLTVVTFLINAAMFAFTLLFFVPKNNYLFVPNKVDFDPVIVTDYVSSWMTAQYFRIAFYLLGLLFAARSIHQSYLVQPVSK